MKTLDLLVVAAVLLADRVHAYTLRVTTCSEEWSHTLETDIAFHFCDGGSYCSSEEFVKDLPSGVNKSDGGTVEVPVSPGFEPTTLDIVKADGVDSWCIAEVTWEGGDNLLGHGAKFALEAEIGTLGCVDGLSNVEEPVACQPEWRFFNLDGSSDYEYDVRLKACAGTSSASVEAYFCSHSACNGTIGEEELVRLEMNDVEGSWTDISFPLPFNPLGVRLEEVDGDATWCADELAFNAFPVVNENTDMTDLETTGSQVFSNIQEHGQGPAPTPAPTISSADETASVEESDRSTWLDAAWEVAVTVVGSILVAAGAGCLAFACRRTRALPLPFRRPSAVDFGSAIEDGKATKQDEIDEKPFYS